MKKLNYHLFSKELLLITDEIILGEGKDFIGWLTSVESKFTEYEYQRLLELLEATSIPTHLSVLPKLIKSLIDVYQSFLPFSFDIDLKNSIESDLKILERSLTYLLEVGDSDVDLGIEALLKPKKRFKLSYLLLTNFHIEVTEKERVQYINVISFLLFQYQLITGEKLYKSSVDSLIKMKSTGNFKFLEFIDLKEFFRLIIRNFKLIDCKYDRQDSSFYDFLSDSIYIKINKKNEVVESTTNPHSGSRLSLVERMLLPYRSNCLKPHQISKLTDKLTSQIESKKAEVKCKSLFTLLSLITSKPDKYIKNLMFSLVPLSGVDFDYICIEDECWYRFDVKLANPRNPTDEHKKFLNKHSNVVALSLPISLIKAAKEILQKQNILTGRLIHLLEYSTTSGDDFSYKGPLTDAAIRSTMFSLLAKNTDPNFAALSLSNTEYVEPTHLYYLSAKHSDIQTQYYAALNNLNLPICVNKRVTQELVFSGSKLTINIETINRHISLLAKSINNSIEQSGDDITKVINSHNMLVCYTVLMLFAVTGHRPRKNFSFSRFTISNDKILISDKVDNKHSAIRILTLPELVQKQISSYLNHCKKITKYLDKSHDVLKKQLILIGSDINAGVNEFSIINEKFELEHIGNKQLSEFLSHDVCLPDNFFRHVLASYFRTKNHGKVAQEQLGHIRDGEHPLVALSPMTLTDNTDDLKELLSSYLSSLGFALVKVNKMKGSFQKYEPIVKVHKPFKYKKKSISTKTLYKWIIDKIQIGLEDIELIKENMQLIQPVFIDINDKISIRWKKSEEQKRAYKILNRLYKNIQLDKKVISRYRLDTGLIIQNNLMNNVKQATLIKVEIKKLVIENVGDKFKFFQLILSIMINTNRKLNFTPSLLNAIQGNWLYTGGMCWLNWTENTIKSRLILDSISVSLKNNLSNSNEREINNSFKYLKNRLEKNHGINRYILKKINDVNELSDFLSLSFEDDIPSTLRYFRSQLIDCSCLSDSAMLRFFSNENVDEMSHGFTKIKRNNLHQIKKEDNCSDNLLKDLRGEFNKLDSKTGDKTQTQLTNTILTVWSKWINTSSIDESTLIQESKNITVTCCAILLWLIDVSKRPGKNRKTMSIGTLTTYLSNVAPSIMSVALDDDIFEYNELSFVAFYTRSLNFKNVENEELRKSVFIDFHKSLLTRGFAVDINWGDVVEQEYIGYGEYNRNIITMNEYEKALNLLNEDECSTEEERRVNKLCLIFCYRLGMRWDDFSGLIIQDIDIDNKVISIKSNLNRRLKSTNGNRMLPFELLLSIAEIELIIEQIDFLQKIKKLGVYASFSSARVFIAGKDQSSSQNKIVDRVVEAIRISTNNLKSTLHDTRRSFCSYMFLMLNYREHGDFYTYQLSLWCRSHDVLNFAQDIRNTLTDTKHCTNKIMPALALFTGHSTPATTVKYYIYLYDLLLYQFNERKIEVNYSIKFIAEKLNIREDLARQTIRRNRKSNYIYSNFQSLVNKAALGDANFSAILIQNTDSQISVKELSKKEIKPSILNELLKLHEKVQTLHKIFSIDENIKDIVTTIKAKTKYEGVQYPIEKHENYYGINFDFKHKENNTKNYIYDKSFVLLCSTYDNLVVKNKVDLFELVSSWSQHFHYKLNLILEKGVIYRNIQGEINSDDLGYISNSKSIVCLNEFVKQSGLSLLIRYKNMKEFPNSIECNGPDGRFSIKSHGESYEIKYHEVNNGITKVLFEQLDIRYPNKPKSVAKKFNYFMFLLTVHKMLENYDNEEGLIKFSQRNNRRL